jgi:hypothetical protein
MDARLKLQERLGQPSHDWLALMTGAMRDLLVGRFDEAERLSENAFAIGRRALGAEALFALRLQRFAVRREQGRLAEIDGDLRRAVGEHPNYPVLRALVALVDVELGHEWAARDALAALAQDDFAALPFDNEWLLAVSFLAETVHRLADAERAGVLSEQAAPYAHLNVNGGGELTQHRSGLPLPCPAGDDDATLRRSRATFRARDRDERPYGCASLACARAA